MTSLGEIDMKSKKTQELERIYARSQRNAERNFTEWKRMDAEIRLKRLRLAKLRKIGHGGRITLAPTLKDFETAEKLLKRW